MARTLGLKADSSTGTLVHETRLNAGKTIETAAFEADVAPHTFARVEHGQEVTARTRRKLDRWLTVQREDLNGGL